VFFASRHSAIFLHISKENYRSFPLFALALQHGNAYKASINRAEIGGRRSVLFSSRISQMASVQAASSLRLDAGSWVVEGNAITLYPPAVTLFDQIEEWLWRQAPPPDPTRPGNG
jgi:hypothetical protein